MVKRVLFMFVMILLTIGVSMVFADGGTIVGEPTWVTKALAVLATIGGLAGSPVVLLFWKKGKIVAQETQDLRDTINCFIFLYQDIITEVKDPKLILDAQNSLDAVAKTLEDTTITSLQKKAVLVRALRARLDKVIPA
jgi:transcriptional/translational regulatory protein YebC/TACO1